MNFVNIFKTLKQVTLNAMDIKFLKAKTDILATKLNKDVHSTLTSISEEVRDTRTDIANIKDVTDKIEFTGDKISSDCLPSYVESIKDIYVDEDTGDFYNVETVVDPVTQEVSYEQGSTIVQRVPGIIYYDINQDKTYRVSNIGKVIEITTSEQYYTKDEADSNFASIDTRSIKVISITSEYDNISIGNESLIRYISNVGYSDILNYINDNNLVVAKYNNSYYSLADISSNTIVFSAVTDSRTIETFSIGSNNIIHYNVKQINVPELYVVPLVQTISKANILSYLQYLDSNKPVIFKRIDIAENNPRTQCATFIPVNYYYQDGSCIHLYGFSENKLNHITIEPQDENTYIASIQASYLVFDEDLEQLYLEKQNKLVSGTNIKTVNNNSLLGSGNIDTSEVLVVIMTRNSGDIYTANKSTDEIWQAYYTDKKVVIAVIPESAGVGQFLLSACDPDADQYWFSLFQSNSCEVLSWTADDEYTYRRQELSFALASALAAKQDALVSGTNIKTLNSASLLGSGDIVIPKGDKGDKGDQGNSGYTGAAGELEVVNNLTQGGATAALSAEQGLVLKGMIDGYTPIMSNEIAQKLVDSSGTITSNTGYWLFVVPVKAGDVVVANCQASNNSAALSYAATADATSVTVLMRHNSDGGYYWGKMQADGYAYICFTHDTTAYYKIVKEQAYELVGVRQIQKGTNCIAELVGSAYTDTLLWSSGFLTTTGSVTSSSSYVYSKKYYKVISGTYLQRFAFSSNAKIAIYNADKVVIGYFSSGNATESIKRTIPANGAYIRISVDKGTTTTTNTLTFVSQQDGDYYLDEDAVADVVETIDNNMVTEKEYLDKRHWRIYSENNVNSIDNYGNDDVRYVYDLPDYTKRLHVRFDFQPTTVLVAAANTDQPLLQIGGYDSYRACLRQRNYEYIYASSYASRGADFCVRVGSSVSSENLNYGRYKTNEGTTAFTLQLKNSTTDNILLFLASTAITLKLNDTTLETITTASTDDLNNVIDRINASTYLAATPYYTTGKTWANVNKGNTNGIPIATLALVPVNFSLDESWHTIEAIIDLENLTSSTAFDGITISKSIATPSSRTLIIGGQTGLTSYGYYNNTPIRVRNLHIAINSFEDAEEVSLLNVTNNNYTKQLISNINPKVIVFEGHGIEVRRDTDTIDNEMSVSTDRLRRVFTYAISKGYVPITFKQFRDWKIRGIALPAKRCFTLMFDDFRIENYFDMSKRLPFEQFGVKPALAIISDRQRSEEVTINGVTYTLGEVFDTIDRAGWYACSHTYDHTNLSNVENANMMTYLHQCIVSAQKLGIHDDVLVYPQGSTKIASDWQIPLSDFALGINIALNGYICKGSSNYYIIRNEIGHGGVSDTEKILERIV